MKKEELLKGLTEEQIAKVRSCKNPEESISLAKAEGIELTNEQLEAVSGGKHGCISTPTYPCPRCGSLNIKYSQGAHYWFMECLDCGCEYHR